MRHRTAALAAGGLLSVVLCLSMALPAGAATNDWPTYHHDGLRSGLASLSGSFSSLTPSWTWSVPQGTASQNLYGEPLIADNLVLVTSNSNWVYALHVSDGSLAWEVQLGQPELPAAGVCGDVQNASQPSIGIVSTPVVDEARSELFVVAALGTGTASSLPDRHLFGLDLATGTIEYNKDVEPGGVSNTYELQRTALAESGNRVLIGFGGNDGDCGTYHGILESVSVADVTKPVSSFVVDRRAGQNMGAIWMGGGAPVVAPDGHVVLATGNGSACSPTDLYDRSDSVLSLSASAVLLDYFAPTTFRTDNCSDLDLGSGQPQWLANGLILQIGKTHTGYLLPQGNLGHISTPASFPVCAGGIDVGGDAVNWETSTTSSLLVPCTSGLEKVVVTGGTSPTGRVVWTSHRTGPPIKAAGSVFAIEISSGTLDQIDRVSGTVVRQYSGLGKVNNHFETPAAGDGILVAAGDGTVVAFTPS